LHFNYARKIMGKDGIRGKRGLGKMIDVEDGMDL
jgi:hypothetical protein